MASSLVLILLVVVVMSEAGSLRNRHIEERDGETSNKGKRDFFSWVTGKENIPDKLPKDKMGSSDDNRQDQENSMEGTSQNDNMEGTPQNDNMEGTPQNDNMEGTPQNDNIEGTPQNETGSPNLPEGSNDTQTPFQNETGSSTKNSESQNRSDEGDEEQSSGEKGSSEENGSQQEPNKRNGDYEWKDIPYIENPPQVLVDPVLHEDADNFGMQAMG